MLLLSNSNPKTRVWCFSHPVIPVKTRILPEFPEFWVLRHLETGIHKTYRFLHEFCVLRHKFPEFSGLEMCPETGVYPRENGDRNDKIGHANLDTYVPIYEITEKDPLVYTRTVHTSGRSQGGFPSIKR